MQWQARQQGTLPSEAQCRTTAGENAAVAAVLLTSAADSTMLTAWRAAPGAAAGRPPRLITSSSMPTLLLLKHQSSACCARRDCEVPSQTDSGPGWFLLLLPGVTTWRAAPAPAAGRPPRQMTNHVPFDSRIMLWLLRQSQLGVRLLAGLQDAFPIRIYFCLITAFPGVTAWRAAPGGAAGLPPMRGPPGCRSAATPPPSPAAPCDTHILT